MAVLSDHESRSLPEAGILSIDPVPPDKAIQPSSIDLTLGNTFRELEDSSDTAMEMAIDIRNSLEVMRTLDRYSKVISIEEGDSYLLKRGGFALAWTRERITLPNFLAARVEGRSTAARVGLSVHQTAPTVHATFSGQLQLELSNAGPFDIKLFPGQTICQLILETLSLPALASLQSVHQYQSGAAQ